MVAVTASARFSPRYRVRQLRRRQRPVAEVIVHEQRDVDQDSGQRRLGTVSDQDGSRILVLADGAHRQQHKDAVDEKPEVRRKGRRLHVVVHHGSVGVTRLPCPPDKQPDAQQPPLVGKHGWLFPAAP